MFRLAALVASFFLLAGASVACGQANSPAGHREHSETAAAEPGSSVPAGPTITIEGMGFGSLGPVAPGTEITIINNDEVEHSVTSRTKGLFDVYVEGKGRATLKAPQDPGEYAFYCLYHPAMLGTLTVQ
ncbi:cupredoxin domain-containing protein [Mycolicibacterium sp. 050232]|uniref:cupredoxin domain-containing protein n=1 Tax=Mycolicibacterium sp. 050232 TaxID=3113982 RepID=UPI002E298048|nr:cupredoxin domain-containing protein [Mycolicibacterium sp. 050232]MED5814750.1 cupredoxin domain-containing protein [Mycolicibacterium sp. 050232]